MAMPQWMITASLVSGIVGVVCTFLMLSLLNRSR